MNKNLKFFLLDIVLIFLTFIFYKNVYSSTINFKTMNSYINKLENISHAHSQCLMQFQKQLSEIEQDIDHFRGKLQENEHQLLKIIEEQKNIIKKIDSFTRIYENILKKNNDNTIYPSKQKNNIFSVSIKDDHHIIDYNKAVNLVLEKKKYEDAIKEFHEFILKYPNSIYQSNAHYWLGQLYYRQGDKNDASYHFALVAKKYPKSLKAADSLLKVGIIMEEIGDKETAYLIYKEINHLYPNTDISERSKKRLINS